MNPLKKILLTLIFILANLCAINVGLFILLRPTNNNVDDGLKKDPVLGWDFSNYYKEFNELGIRTHYTKNELIQIKKYKILFLGNSVVAGDHYPLSQSFSSVANAHLQKKIPNKYLVLNGGQEGYDIYREFYKFKRDLSLSKPQVVVWFPGSNDFKTNELKPFATTENVDLYNLDNRLWPNSPREGFQLLSAKIQSMKEDRTNSFLWSSKNIGYAQRYVDPLSKEISRDLDKEIKLFHTYLTENHIKFIAAIIPSQYFCKFFTMQDAKGIDNLLEMFNKYNIPVINLIDKLPCHSQKIYGDFVHLNELGHQIVGELLSDALTPYLD
jgi:lysophospholipase L1-like esterase